ncbi:hypothetical protein AAVH_39710, partial [Aphelenchoides avenae]
TIYTAQGPRLAWGLEIVIISFSLVMWLVFYRRMVPLREMTPFVNAAYDSSVDSTESTPTKSFDKSPLANRASIVSDSIAQRPLTA